MSLISSLLLFGSTMLYSAYQEKGKNSNTNKKRRKFIEKERKEKMLSKVKSLEAARKSLQYNDSIMRTYVGIVENNIYTIDWYVVDEGVYNEPLENGKIYIGKNFEGQQVYFEKLWG